MISCAEAVKELWEYLDGAVEATRQEAIEEHLAFCRRCCGELEFAQELRSLLVSSRREQIPDEVLARLTATLDQLGPT